MTVQTTDSPGHSAPAWVEDEIDLRQYLLVLLAWWREIVLVTLFAGLVAFGAISYLRYTRDMLYKASINVVLTVVSSQIQLDERVQTTIDSQIGATNSDRRASLLALIKDGAVIQSVIDELGDQLPPQYRIPGVLAGVISADIPTSGQSNVLTIAATTPTPELSALLAETWARQYTAHVNQLYGDVPEVTLEAVQGELANARAAYDSAQTELEAFIASNRLDALNRQINEKTALRDSLVNARTLAITTVINSESEAQTLAYAYLAKRPVNVAISDLSTEEATAVTQVNDLRERQRVAEIQLERARTLERTLVEGGDAAAQTTSNALQLLKDQVFAAPPFGLPAPNQTSVLQATTPDTAADAETQLADVRALIAALETYSQELAEQVAAADSWAMVQDSSDAITQALTLAANPATADADSGVYQQALADAFAALLAPSAINTQLTAAQGAAGPTQQLITSVETDLQTLRADLAAETSREQQLTQERDLAWNTYDALRNKLMELSLLRTSANSLLRLAGPALTLPVAPISYLLPVAAAIAAGFLGMVLFALLANSVGAQPFFSRRPTGRPLEQR